MPLVLILSAAAVATVAGLAFGGAGTVSQGGCAAGGSRTLVTDRLARVYELPGRAGNDLFVYGCAGGHRTLLGRASGLLRVERFRLGGDYVGFARVARGVDVSSSTIEVVDLRSGRRVHQAPAATPIRRPESFTAVTALVVDARGAVAWIASQTAIGTAVSYEVHRIDRRGPALLDGSAAIDPGSLRRNGRTVSWTDRGRRRTAVLA
jgi:hypothetical protein